MKKILFVMTPMLPMPPVRGGAVQTLVQSLVDYNEAKPRFKLTVTSIPDKRASGEKYRYTKFIYVNIPQIFIYFRNHQVKFATGFAYKMVQALYTNSVKKLVASNEYDAVIFENEIHIETFNKFRGNPLKVLHLHNDYINIEVKNAWKVVEKFDYIIAVSDYIKRRVGEISPSSKRYTIYNGIEIKRFKRDNTVRKAMRAQLGIDDEDVVFCFAGRLVKEKGILELVKAFNMLPDRLGKNAVLLIIGSRLYGGGNTEDAFIHALKAESDKSIYRIIYTGFIDYKEISKYYAAADVGCMLSISEEAFSLSIIEYKASGMPVIVSDAGGNKEQMSGKYGCVVKRSTGYIEKIEKALEMYLENKEIISEQGRMAEIDANNYSEGFYCQQFYKTLEKMIDFK